MAVKNLRRKLAEDKNDAGFRGKPVRRQAGRTPPCTRKKRRRVPRETRPASGGSVSRLTVFHERDSSHDEPLVGGDHVEARPGAADHARHVVENVVALGLLLEQLHVRVEHVSLRDVDALAQDLCSFYARR